MPFASASGTSAGQRQAGMLPDIFHDETVDGVRSSAVATATVPPSAFTISFAVIMAAFVTINVI